MIVKVAWSLVSADDYSRPFLLAGPGKLVLTVASKKLEVSGRALLKLVCNVNETPNDARCLGSSS